MAPGAPAALASIISMLHRKNSTHFIRKHNMQAARVKTSHSLTLLTPYYAVLRLNMPIRPVHHDERYKAQVSQQGAAQNHYCTGSSSMSNMLLAQRASSWLSFEACRGKLSSACATGSHDAYACRVVLWKSSNTVPVAQRSASAPSLRWCTSLYRAPQHRCGLQPPDTC